MSKTDPDTPVAPTRKTTIDLANKQFPLPYDNLGATLLTDSYPVETECDPAYAVYYIRRNLPPPNTLLAFQAILDNFQRQETFTPLLLIGKAGTGKTTSAQIAGQLLDNKPPLVFDAGNRSLDELLVEPQFSENSETLIHRIEERFNKTAYPPLSELSRRILSEAVPQAIVKTNSESRLNTSLLHSQQDIQALVNAVKQVCELEGIHTTATLGVTFREGMLIRAAKEGRRLIIDEIDKAIEGTGTSLQQVWLALRNQGKAHTIDKHGITFTFDPKTIPQGFGIVLCANNAEDGMDIAGLRQSTRDRLDIINVPDNDGESIAVRIGQILLGFNFTTIEPLKGNPGTIAHQFANLANLNNEPLSEDQMRLLQRYPETIQACRQLGAFYHEWAMAVLSEDQAHPDPQLEAAREIGLKPPSVRSAQQHIQEAITLKTLNPLADSEIQPVTDVTSLINSTHKPAFANPAQSWTLGRRIEHVILHAIHTFPGGPATKRTLHSLAIKHGIVPEPDEEKNANLKRKLIRDLLNTNEPVIAIAPETEILQRDLFDILQKQYPHIQPSDIHKVIPANTLQETINAQDKKAPLLQILGVNPDYMDGTDPHALRPFPVLDMMDQAQIDYLVELNKAAKEKQQPLPYCSRQEIQACLKHPQILEYCIDKFFNRKDPQNSQEQGYAGNLLFTNQNQALRVTRIACAGTPDESGNPTREMVLLINFPNKHTHLIGTNIAPFTSPHLTCSPDVEHLLQNIEKFIDTNNAQKSADNKEPQEDKDTRIALLHAIDCLAHAGHKQQAEPSEEGEPPLWDEANEQYKDALTRVVNKAIAPQAPLTSLTHVPLKTDGTKLEDRFTKAGAPRKSGGKKSARKAAEPEPSLST